jgi:hypothetical protein
VCVSDKPDPPVFVPPLAASPWLQVPDLLQDFVVCGALPSASALQDAAVVPTLLLGEAMQHLKEAATAANAATAASSRGTGDGSSSSQGAGGGSPGISSQSENGF